MYAHTHAKGPQPLAQGGPPLWFPFALANPFLPTQQGFAAAEPLANHQLYAQCDSTILAFTACFGKAFPLSISLTPRPFISFPLVSHFISLALLSHSPIPCIFTGKVSQAGDCCRSGVQSIRAPFKVFGRGGHLGGVTSHAGSVAAGHLTGLPRFEVPTAVLMPFPELWGGLDDREAHRGKE